MSLLTILGINIQSFTESEVRGRIPLLWADSHWERRVSACVASPTTRRDRLGGHQSFQEADFLIARSFTGTSRLPGQRVKWGFCDSYSCGATLAEGTFSFMANFTKSLPHALFLAPFTITGLNLHVETAAIRCEIPRGWPDIASAPVTQPFSSNPIWKTATPS